MYTFMDIGSSSSLYEVPSQTKLFTSQLIQRFWEGSLMVSTGMLTVDFLRSLLLGWVKSLGWQ